MATTATAKAKATKAKAKAPSAKVLGIMTDAADRIRGLAESLRLTALDIGREVLRVEQAVAAEGLPRKVFTDWLAGLPLSRSTLSTYATAARVAEQVPALQDRPATVLYDVRDLPPSTAVKLAALPQAERRAKANAARNGGRKSPARTAAAAERLLKLVERHRPMILEGYRSAAKADDPAKAGIMVGIRLAREIGSRAGDIVAEVLADLGAEK
ncbi:MAG: hypothetical protein KatS3mg015_2503 [Fimbriimonadales bacterium]|nr:MAG: hypothetical protein KatS3mg015_2503 [Fimbriimonadales bacterium]